MGSSEGQTYCLRWNNHKSNLVEILDALIKMESYVDCTIVVDEQIQFKAHRVVLAANSPYFQSILQDVPMDHCSILFPGVQAFEMRALLEYMYTGEVNVTQSQIPRIMKIAEQLEVKGLFDMTDLKEKFTKFEDNDPTNHSSSSYTVPFPPPLPPPPPPPPQSTKLTGVTPTAFTPPTFRETSKDINRDLNERVSHHQYSHSHSPQPHQSHYRSLSSINLDRNINERRLSSSERRMSGDGGHRLSSASAIAAITDLHHQQQQQQQSSPIISTSSNITQYQAQSSSSPPPSYLYKSPYSSLYTKSPGPSESRRSAEDRSERYSSSSDRHERQERGLHNDRNTERLQDRQTVQQQQRQISNSPTPPPPPPPPASTQQQHTTWPISSVIPPSSIPTSAAAAAMLSSVYESASDMNPLKRKKLSSISSMLMASDTPILRNVLAQSHAADSSHPMPLVKQERENEKQTPLNCSGPSDYNNDKYGKYDEPHSPFIDKSFDDEGLDCSPNERLGNISYSSSNNSQKPEWKRYKQYTRSDILAAIECVRNGMSALQASRKFGVPSRTLYDKVKKLGITTGRPMNRTMKRSPSTGSSSASFPFGISGTTHPAYSQAEAMLSQMHESNELHSSHLRNSSNGNGNNTDKEHRNEHHLPPNLPHPAAAALLDPTFLQQAFESRGGDIAGREALHAMALAAAAHAAVNGISTSPGTNGTARSPSPGFALKYSRSHQDSPPPPSTTTTTTTSLNRTSSSVSSQQHQSNVSHHQDYDRDRNREIDNKMDYEHESKDDGDDDDDDDDDDDGDESSRSPGHHRNRIDDNNVSERRELEFVEGGIRNRLSRKRNLIKIEHEQDRVEDLSVNRKETITARQQEVHSPTPQPLSPQSSSLHAPHSPSSLQTNNDNNHQRNQNSSYNSGSNQQSSGGVIMPPIITKLSGHNINESTEYPVSLESSTTLSNIKRELSNSDEIRD